MPNSWRNRERRSVIRFSGFAPRRLQPSKREWLRSTPPPSGTPRFVEASLAGDRPTARAPAPKPPPTGCWRGRSVPSTSSSCRPPSAPSPGAVPENGPGRHRSCHSARRNRFRFEFALDARGRAIVSVARHRIFVPARMTPHLPRFPPKMPAAMTCRGWRTPAAVSPPAATSTAVPGKSRLTNRKDLPNAVRAIKTIAHSGWALMIPRIGTAMWFISVGQPSWVPNTILRHLYGLSCALGSSGMHGAHGVKMVRIASTNPGRISPGKSAAKNHARRRFAAEAIHSAAPQISPSA